MPAPRKPLDITAEECRRAFERRMGQAVPWSNDLQDWPEPPPKPPFF
jgi:hypothetical protein